jgi:peptide/nickel transport system substrate-binding protein
MKRSPVIRKVYTILACILISMLVLGACAAPAKAPAPVSTGPKYGGILHLAYIMDINLLDFSKLGTIVVRSLPFLYTNTLTTWSGKNDESYQLVPCLATSWEISPDGLGYTFNLRKGVKWQNLPPVNGREFTSADVKWNIDRIKDPATKSPVAPYLAAVDRVETPDNYTVKIVMKAPDPFFIYATAGIYMGAHEVAEQDGDLSKTVLGTGPFMIDKYSQGSGISFKRNPDYWDKGKPYLDGVECTYMTDASARLAAFRAGRLDRLVEGKANTDLIKSSVPGAQIVPGIGLVGSALYFNLKNPDKPWADKKVRQAIQYAIDYDGLIQAVLNGSGSRTDFLAPSFKDWGARQIADLPKQDIAKSKAMLADAGYPNGFKATMLQHMDRMDAWGGAVEPLVAMLKVVGVDAQIVPAAQADFVAKMRSGDYELGTNTMICTGPDPDGCLPPMYFSKGAYNRMSYNNPTVDGLIAQERKSVADVTQRQQAVKQIMQTLADDVPVIPLFYQYNYSVAQPWVKGWNNSADPLVTTAWYEVANVWLDK